MVYQVKVLVVAAVSALLLMHPADADITYDPECDPHYKDISPQHTMCIVGDVGTEVVLDQAAKDAIVQKHNDLREGVNPLAGDMTKMVWDEDLAIVAAKWARQCVQGHDPKRNVPSLPGIHVGQNGAFGYGSWDSAVQGWYNEVQYFEYGVGSTTGNWEDVGHYTQVVNAKSQRIGCGLAECPTKYYFCNYAIGQYGVERPYLNSTQSCSECPNQCDASGKLCDCGGKLCLNGGTLDLATCTCSCDEPLYSGDTCETLTCPSGDSWVCGPDNQWPPSYCTQFSNVPGSCPYMCGICQHECGDKMCYNGGTMNYQTCQCTCATGYDGDTCQDQENCPTGDSWVCGPDNQWPPSYCTMYSNVPGSCPYMCDVCPHECGDKMCYNGGTMNYQTCQCTCKDLYTGDTCETLDCPEADKSWCGPGKSWPPEYCDMFSNVPPTCPYMCGLC
ncbi:hypothetical protein BaRGS_00014295 [Batillaria attramentaria]|uniref:EGF-like domain-containing protein n=1 Tax=Batillaria attramentaria TaxID=370345 RepID=A0ABD0L5B9_9CAEN